jgi:hypothetical protein
MSWYSWNMDTNGFFDIRSVSQSYN